MKWVEDCRPHFSDDLSEGIKQFATDEMFPRYIFTSRIGKRQYGYCTHCHKEFWTSRLKHLSDAVCPECNSSCMVKASGISRKKMIDEAYFVYYEKSLVNPSAIVARGIYAVRDYRGAFRTVETKYCVLALYVFEMGGSSMLRRWGYYNTSDRVLSYGQWDMTGSIHSLFNRDHILFIPTSYSRASIEAAVKDTPFRFSTWETYESNQLTGDMVVFFDLYSRYPCIEFLTKFGLQHLVWAKLKGFRTYSAINWRGKNLFNVLKVTKKELNAMKAMGIEVSFEFLKLLQLTRKDGSNFTLSEINNLVSSYCSYIDDFVKLQPYGSIRKILGYFEKQRSKYSKHFANEYHLFVTFRDYLSDCVNLGMDTRCESVIFPKNLYRAHQNTIKQVQAKAAEEREQENAEKNRMLQERLRKLKKQYCFESETLLIRPALSVQELIDEGMMLHHCVGTYADKYVKGETIILFIRRISDPDKPYFTLELENDGKIRQVHGLYNCNPDDTVSAFIEDFKTEKLHQKRVQIQIPA